MPAVLFLKPPESGLLFQLVPNLPKLLTLVVDVTCGLKKGDSPASKAVTSWVR